MQKFATMFVYEITSSMENKSQKRIIPSQPEETRILESNMMSRAEMETPEIKTKQ